MGAKVYGLSLDIPTSPNNYEVCDLENISNTTFSDLRDLGVSLPRDGRKQSAFDLLKSKSFNYNNLKFKMRFKFSDI